MHALMQLFQLLFLLVGHVVKLGHAVEHALLLFRRTVVEFLELVAQLFLPGGRQLLKLRIAAQKVLLLLRWQIVILAEPLASRRSSGLLLPAVVKTAKSLVWCRRLIRSILS